MVPLYRTMYHMNVLLVACFLYVIYVIIRPPEPSRTLPAPPFHHVQDGNRTAQVFSFLLHCPLSLQNPDIPFST